MARMTIQVGETLVLWCKGCRAQFEWVVPSGWQSGGPAHHSASCKKRHRKRRNSQTAFIPCRTPDKKLYLQQEKANEAVVLMSKRYGAPFATYRCDCGGLHVGSLPFKRKGELNE